MGVRLVDTGRELWCTPDEARHWIARGYAVPVDETPSETAARTRRPVPVSRPDMETR